MTQPTDCCTSSLYFLFYRHLYNEFLVCAHRNGDDEAAPACADMLRKYRSICPADWVERWNEQREAGSFPGVTFKAEGEEDSH